MSDVGKLARPMPRQPWHPDEPTSGRRVGMGGGQPSDF